MAPEEFKICKHAVVGSKRHIILTIPDTHEIIMKPGSATSQSAIIVTYKIGL
jgi:phosphoserine aminotransferase